MKEKSEKKTDPTFSPEEKEMNDARDIQDVATESNKKKGGTIFSGEEGVEEAAQPVDLKAQLDELKRKAEEDRDRLLRVLAEFDNYKKRMNRQIEDAKKYANELLLRDLLSVVDNLERAISSNNGSTIEGSKESCVVEGVEMTLNEILKLLSKFHVTPVKAEGEAFDPAYHEAVMQQESADHPTNTVIQVLQKGYMIHDRLLRPAMVVVSKGKSPSQA